MAVDWSQLFNLGTRYVLPGLQQAGNIATGLFNPSSPSTFQGGGAAPTSTFGGIPNALIGSGLTLASAAQKEPGEVTEARQFLRNRFTSPTAISDQFTGQLGGLASSFQPLLTQQREQDIAGIQQRFAQAFPSQVGAQGPEFGTLSRYISAEALPREQGLLGELGLKLIDTQGRAAETILNANKPDPLSAALGQLGGQFLGQNVLGSGGSTPFGQPGQPQVNPQTGQLTQPTSSSSPWYQQISQMNPAELATQLGYGAGGIAGSPFVFTTASGQAVPIGIDEASQLATQGYGSQITAQTGATGVAGGIDVGMPGAGLLGPAGAGSAGALASSAASAIGGGLVGYKVGTAFADWYEKQHAGETSNIGGYYRGAIPGAVSGGAVGFAVGGPVGAAIGAVVGGISGGVSGIYAERRREDANIARETQLTGQERPQVLQAAEQFYATNQQTEPALRQAMSRISEPLLTRLQQGDPAVQQLLAQAKSLVQSFGGGVAEGVGGGIVPETLRTLLQYATIGGKYGPENRGNPEGTYGMLFSDEIGKFMPAKDVLVKEIGWSNQAGQLFNKFAQLAQGG
jgi:hypothetical protein